MNSNQLLMAINSTRWWSVNWIRNLSNLLRRSTHFPFKSAIKDYTSYLSNFNYKFHLILHRLPGCFFLQPVIPIGNDTTYGTPLFFAVFEHRRYAKKTVIYFRVWQNYSFIPINTAMTFLAFISLVGVFFSAILAWLSVCNSCIIMILNCESAQLSCNCALDFTYGRPAQSLASATPFCHVLHGGLVLAADSVRALLCG